MNVLCKCLDDLCAVTQDETRPLHWPCGVIVDFGVARGPRWAELCGHGVPLVDAHVGVEPVDVGEVQPGLNLLIEVVRS
jgi:hypothetical protein